MEETKHPGQPTKYNPEFIQEIDVYLKEMKENKRLPTIEGFAMHVGVDHDTVLNWANRRLKNEKGEFTNVRANPEFFGALKKIKTAQKEQLIVDGFYMGRNVNANMGIFLLKANHGMIEVEHVDHTTKGEKLPVPILGGKTNVPVDNGTE